MMNSSVVAVTDAMKDAAGLMVWWELTGMVDLDDLREALTEEFGIGLGADTEIVQNMMPMAPSLETALARAAASALTSKRQLLRPLSRRGAWEIVLETVEASPDEEEATERSTGRERCTYKSLLTGRVEKTTTGRQCVVEGPDATLRNTILAKVDFYEKVLTPSDYSTWLLGRAGALHAIGLRDRGGFYFIPKDKVEDWKKLVAVTRACSQHTCREIPAMRTEEAVEAILASVATEATEHMAAVEVWLAKETVSTRGLNAEERQADALRLKLDHYCKLLGRSMPGLEERLERLTGAIQAAKIVAKEPKG